MYSYINGLLTEINSTHVVIDNNGIGYKIFVSNPYSFKLEEIYKLYIYTHIREDEYSLYGFKEIEERDLFLKLIEVKGVGPKMALPMLATGSPNGIMDAINRENILYLKKFPKIGDKVAKQIILDLKGKFKVENIEIEESDELYEALKGLGYKNQDIMKVISKVEKDKTIEEKIKQALKLLLK
ncbi:MAG: Holliday junction branch migration protein RuvA [Tenericutes bacterium]|nr:Holliday junction branch migration protein RuvA [Bacilli bacterium]MDD3995326.1 Holliday junction branch migration protein RuvA [Bacilli bacterium]MDD4831620.1 Holliday junction branch migration protein RuvA [Bacilli bacterium]NLV90167.1 Holliday junction branch migration protein RuvA [Mycoplasmatota bacterium]